MKKISNFFNRNETIFLKSPTSQGYNNKKVAPIKLKYIFLSRASQDLSLPSVILAASPFVGACLGSFFGLCVHLESDESVFLKFCSTFAFFARAFVNVQSSNGPTIVLTEDVTFFPICSHAATINFLSRVSFNRIS